MTYSIASESLGGGVCFQACLLVCKGLGYTNDAILGILSVAVNYTAECCNTQCQKYMSHLCCFVSLTNGPQKMFCLHPSLTF